jgi:RraA family protein
MSLGFRIVAMPPRPPKALIVGLSEMVTPHLSDCMGRTQGASGALKPMYRGAGTPAQKTMCGPALTVKTAPGDNLMVHKALDIAEPGDVVVVDAGGAVDQAIIGEIMSRYGASRKLGGIVIDGAIRDAAALSASDFPVFARAAVHKGPYKDGPGQIGVPVSIAGMVVMPGDIVVGDADGLVAVSQGEAEALLAAARAVRVKEDAVMKEIDAGRMDRGWVDAALKAKGLSL